MQRLKDRAAYCKFYGMSPGDARKQTVLENRAFAAYMTEYLERQRKANGG